MYITTMLGKMLLFLALATIVVLEVSSQISSTTAASNAQNQWAQSGWNQSPSGNASSVPAVTQFFDRALRGEVWGIRKCKKPKDCGLGLRCDGLLNLCVPFNTPLLLEIEKPCSNESECSGMHSCQNGFCRFCGPKSCRSNLDCCGGSFASAGQAGKFYECLNIEETEKLALAQQLGRVPQGFKPLAKVQGGKSPEDQLGVESEELLQLGPSAQGDVAMYGKRCWARCNADNDCYESKTPAHIKKAIGCCNNVCARRQSCVRASPQAIQQLQQLQQQQQLQLNQAAQQQQILQQQQLQQQQQQQLLQGQQHSGKKANQGGWGTGVQQVAAPQQKWGQQQWSQQQARPQSWQEAQQAQGNQIGQPNQGGMLGSGVPII